MADNNKCPATIDRGYSWVVLVASLIVQTMSVGFSVGGVGVMLISFSNHFPEADKTQLGWIGSLRNVQFLATPIVVILIKKLGCRVVTIGGAILSGLGIGLSALSTEIWHVYLSYGIVGGLGIACTYTASCSAVNEYFNKKRNIAFPVGSLGNGLGPIIFAYVLQSVVKSTDHKTALLFTALLKIVELICGIFFKPNDGNGVIPARFRRTRVIAAFSGSTTNVANKRDVEKYAPMNGVEATTDKEMGSNVSTGKVVDLNGALTSSTGVSPNGDGAQVTNGDEIPTIESTAANKAVPSSSTGLLTMFLILKRWQAWTLIANSFCWGFSVISTEILVPSYIVRRGVSSDDASLGITLIGAGYLASAFVTFGAGARSYDRFLLYLLTCGVMGIISILLSVSEKVEVYLTLCTIFGVWLGFLLSLFMSVLSDFDKPELFNDYFGLYILFEGVGSICGPEVLETIQHTSGDDVGWYVCGGVGIAGTLVLLPVYLMRRCKFGAEGVATIAS